MKYLLIIINFFLIQFVNAQELTASVTLNYSQVQNSNNSAFKTLEKSLREFINTTKWTDKTYGQNEKIECSFTIIISSIPSSNKYKASLVVQSRRPVFNSIYYTPILNINDTDFSFEYAEFDQFTFNERRFSEKNLTDVISFYIYVILGYDADTFSQSGGTEYFKIADKIANTSQNNGYTGWSMLEGSKTKASLTSRILNPDYITLRNVMYDYHRNGLDMMYNSPYNAKEAMGSSIIKLSQFNDNYTLMYPLDIFIATKKDEISKIFSSNTIPYTDTQKLKGVLTTISPINTEFWNKIKD